MSLPVNQWPCSSYPKFHLDFSSGNLILPSRWLGESNESTLPATPPKKENRNLSPKQIILFQYQTTDPLFFRKHLFNGFLLVQTTQQINLKPPEFCKSIVIWFGFFSVRGCDLGFDLFLSRIKVLLSFQSFPMGFMELAYLPAFG